MPDSQTLEMSAIPENSQRTGKRTFGGMSPVEASVLAHSEEALEKRRQTFQKRTRYKAEEALLLWLRGWTVARIADTLGLSEGTVKRKLGKFKRQGMLIRPRVLAERGEHDAEILSEYDAGRGKEVAAKYGLPLARVKAIAAREAMR
jgi:AraC-like DNA-binding protein